jgi:acyl-CoA synthetase (AMP-forming)/AMP-acid ligase II
MTSRSAHPTLAKLVARPGLLAREFAVLFRSGVLPVGRPDKTARQLHRLWQHGPTLGGAYAVGAVREPDRVAVQDESTSRTYRELDERVRGLVRGLSARGAGPGDTVALLGRNGVPFVEALVATSRLGAHALLLNTFMSPQQIRDVLVRERPRAVFADPDLFPLLDGAPEGLLTVALRPSQSWRTGDVTLEDLLVSGPDPQPSRVRGRIVVLTSGTTGTPKGARRPAPTSLSPAASMLSRIKLIEGDRIMIASPLFHTWALGLLQIAPALAATVVLRERADPETVLEAVSSARCTGLIAVPVILDRILRLPPEVRERYDTLLLRVVAVSGSALAPDVVRRFQGVFGDVLYNLYGSTEISWATIADPADLRLTPGTAGRPPLGTRLRIVTEDGRPAPRGEIGRIFVGNELMFEGYTGGADKERLGDLMATGDLGYLDEHGLLMVVGRDDDLVISGAEKIYPKEVEETILTLPGVREVAVVGRPDPQLGQRVVAFVVCEDGVRLSPEQVKDHVRQRLARFAVPKAVGFMAELPRTPTGKVIPRMLPDAALAVDRAGQA